MKEQLFWAHGIQPGSSHHTGSEEAGNDSLKQQGTVAESAALI